MFEVETRDGIVEECVLKNKPSTPCQSKKRTLECIFGIGSTHPCQNQRCKNVHSFERDFFEKGTPENSAHIRILWKVLLEVWLPRQLLVQPTFSLIVHLAIMHMMQACKIQELWDFSV